MKKLRALSLICFCFLIMALTSCRQNPNQAIESLPETSPSEESSKANPEDEISAEWITPSENIKIDGMNLLWQQGFTQFVADDDATLSLYVNAETDEDGNFWFSDGQDWVLLMETSLGNYPLFPRQFVQLGGVSCAAFNEYVDDNTTVSHVLVTVQETAGYWIYDCVFDTEKGAFQVMPVYNSGNIGFSAGSINFDSYHAIINP